MRDVGATAEVNVQVIVLVRVASVLMRVRMSVNNQTPAQELRQNPAAKKHQHHASGLLQPSLPRVGQAAAQCPSSAGKNDERGHVAETEAKPEPGQLPRRHALPGASTHERSDGGQVVRPEAVQQSGTEKRQQNGDAIHVRMSPPLYPKGE